MWCVLLSASYDVDLLGAARCRPVGAAARRASQASSAAQAPAAAAAASSASPAAAATITPTAGAAPANTTAAANTAVGLTKFNLTDVGLTEGVKSVFVAQPPPAKLLASSKLH